MASPDRAIWAHARDRGFVIVTRDEDFHRLSVLHGPTPKVIWVRLGHCSTDDVIGLAIPQSVLLQADELRALCATADAVRWAADQGRGS